MRGKNKTSTLANMLAREITGKKEINPLGFINPDRSLYREVWTQYDLNQYCSYLIWDGLPNGLTSWNLNRMMYFRGTLAGFKWRENIYVLPYTICGGLNPYGFPVKIQPIPYNGGPVGGDPSFFGKGYELNVNIDGNEIPPEEVGAVLLYDSIPFNQGSKSPSRYFLNQIIINEIAETLARVNISVAVGNKKILLVVKDTNQQEIVRNELDQIFGSDSPFGVISSPLETQSVQQTSDFNASDLFNVVRQWDSIRCFTEGIAANFGNEKKEREITGELTGNEEQVNLIGDMRLELAKLWADNMNKAFGLNITVRKRVDDYEEQTDGRGMDTDEEALFGAGEDQENE